MARNKNRQTQRNPNSNKSWLQNQEGINPIAPYLIQYHRYVNHYYEWIRQIAYQLYEWEGFSDDVPTHMIEPMLHEYGTIGWCNDSRLGEVLIKGVGENIGTYNIPTSFRSTDRFFEHISFPVYYFGRYKFANSGILMNNRLMVHNERYNLSSTSGFMMYAEMLATLKQISDINLNAQKTPIILLYDDLNQQDIMKAYDKFNGNNPVIFSRRNLSEDGKSAIGGQLKDMITTLKTDTPFLVDKIEAQKEKVWNECMSWLGLSSVAHVKAERMVTSEAESNQDQFLGMQNSLLQARLEFCKLYKQLTGRELICRPTSQTFLDERGGEYAVNPKVVEQSD